MSNIYIVISKDGRIFQRFKYSNECYTIWIHCNTDSSYLRPWSIQVERIYVYIRMQPPPCKGDFTPECSAIHTVKPPKQKKFAPPRSYTSKLKVHVRYIHLKILFLKLKTVSYELICAQYLLSTKYGKFQNVNSTSYNLHPVAIQTLPLFKLALTWFWTKKVIFRHAHCISCWVMTKMLFFLYVI